MAIINKFFNVFDCLIITIITTVLWLIVKHYYDRRRIFKLGSKLPGPKPLPIIGNAWHFLGYKYDILTKLKRYRRNDKLLALWFGHGLQVFLYSPEYAEILCSSSKLLDRTDRADCFKSCFPSSLLFTSGQQWKKSRKIMENALPYSELKNFIPAIEEQGDILIQRLREELGKPCFPIIRYAKACMFDVISDVSLESDLKAQKSELPLVNEIEVLIGLANKRAFSVLYQYDFLFKLFQEGKEYFCIIDSALKLANEAILEKKQKYEVEKEEKARREENVQKSQRKIFWKSLLDDKSLSLADVRDHVLTLIVGGYETTSTTISCVLMMLALHPVIQEKAYKEVISVVDGNFNDKKVQQLEYLDMIVKETLRLFPVVPLTFRKAAEDVQMGDYLIPAGANVSVNTYELHRDPELYENPHQFNPDNFLPENIAKRHPFSYIPFAGGKRKCIAYKLAPLIVKIIVAKLLLSYKFDCDYKEMGDIKFQGNISLILDDDGLVRITKRQ